LPCKSRISTKAIGWLYGNQYYITWRTLLLYLPCNMAHAPQNYAYQQSSTSSLRLKSPDIKLFVWPRLNTLLNSIRDTITIEVNISPFLLVDYLIAYRQISINITFIDNLLARLSSQIISSIITTKYRLPSSFCSTISTERLRPLPQIFRVSLPYVPLVRTHIQPPTRHP